MVCPSCNDSLEKFAVTTHQSGRFDVDHCLRCGGTWFDPYEINRIPYSEVLKLAKYTKEEFKVPQKKKNFCPIDHLVLEPLKGGAVPAGVRLLWCPKCFGIWTSQKDLEQFKKNQEEIIFAYEERGKYFPTLSRVIIPALTFLVLIFFLFTTLKGLQKSQEDRIFAENQIKRVQVFPLTNTSVAITFETATFVTSTISFGLSSIDMTEKEISKSLTTQHRAYLTNLKSMSNYFYRLKFKDSYGNTFNSEIRQFTTK